MLKFCQILGQFKIGKILFSLSKREVFDVEKKSDETRMEYRKLELWQICSRDKNVELLVMFRMLHNNDNKINCLTVEDTRHWQLIRKMSPESLNNAV